MATWNTSTRCLGTTDVFNATADVQYSTATVLCTAVELLGSDPSSQQTTLQQFISYYGK